MAKKQLKKRQVDKTKVGDGAYYLVQRKDGKLRCSCGSELIKHDDDSWKCAGGYPIYRPADGDIMKDKFGEVRFRMKPHTKDGANYGGGGEDTDG